MLPPTKRPAGYWVLVVFCVLSLVLLGLGQTVAVFDYDAAVRLGLQESRSQVSGFGVQVNRAFGAGDTVVYLPLIAASLVGLVRGKRWAVITAAAVAGVSAYWSVTMAFYLLFLPGTSGYHYVPGFEIWLFIGSYAAFGVWGLFYLPLRGSRMFADAASVSTMASR